MSAAKYSPAAAAITIARLALNSRLRSSRRCSMRGIEPSDARWKSDGLRRLAGLTGEGLAPALLVGGALHRVDDRHVVLAHGQRRSAGLRLGLGGDVVLHEAPRLRLDDPQGATEGAGEIGQALGAEEE